MMGHSDYSNGMTVGDLIATLEGIDPDTPVRLAQQPSWPFEYSIGDVVQVEVGGPEEGKTVRYLADDGTTQRGMIVAAHETQARYRLDTEDGEIEVSEHQIHSDDCHRQAVVYIGEGRQERYLQYQASEELGWGRQ